MVSWAIGIVIFGYAGISMYRHIQTSKKGKCATCELNKKCTNDTCSPTSITKLDK